jgi:DNA-binding response OmpR family regulator
LDKTNDLVHIMRVLVAEDDEDGREALAAALRQLGAEVNVVADGGRFLVAIASQYRDGNALPPPDLIVTDVVMPVCSGLSVLEAMRAAHWTIPVIVITGRDSPAIRASTERCGATLMLKPIDLLTFQRTVRRLVPEPKPVSVP